MGKESKPNLVILFSGSGSTMGRILEAARVDEIGYNVSGVISGNQEAYGIQRAKLWGMSGKIDVIDPNWYRGLEGRVNDALFGEALLKTLKMFGADMVSQNGWLPKTPSIVVEEYAGRIINQHPGALDPSRVDWRGRSLDFGNMFGSAVTCAAVAYNWLTGEWIGTESTIHHVTDRIDGGEVISVQHLKHPLFERYATIGQLMENPAFLMEATKVIQAALLPIEHKNVISVLDLMSRGARLSVLRGRPLIADNRVDQLFQARRLARRLYPKG